MNVETFLEWLRPYVPQIIAGGITVADRISDALKESGIEHDREELRRVIAEANAAKAREDAIAAGGDL